VRPCWPGHGVLPSAWTLDGSMSRNYTSASSYSSNFVEQLEETECRVILTVQRVYFLMVFSVLRICERDVEIIKLPHGSRPRRAGLLVP
jgi:hypothetical protein